MITPVLVLIFIIILLMLGIAMFFKENLVDVFFTNKNFVASIISISIISVSYWVLINPSSIELINQTFAIFNTVPFMLAFFGGGFMLFIGLLIEAIMLFYIIRAILSTKSKESK
jgi:hypothetical protein